MHILILGGFHMAKFRAGEGQVKIYPVLPRSPQQGGHK